MTLLFTDEFKLFSPGIGITEKELPKERPNELTAKTLELHDVDSNLINSDELASIMCECLAELGGPHDEIMRIKQDVEAASGSFDTYSKLLEICPKLVEEVMELTALEVTRREDLPYDDPRCLFLPGARELIKKQSPQGSLRAFVTRGGEDFQRFKLGVVLGLDMNRELYAVLSPDNKETKAEMCKKSFHAEDGEDGEFVFRWLHNAPEQGVRVQSVIITDDKKSELIGLEKLGRHKAIGFWHRTGERPSQVKPREQELPANVFEIRSLESVGQFSSRIGRIALGKTHSWPLENTIRQE